MCGSSRRLINDVPIAAHLEMGLAAGVRAPALPPRHKDRHASGRPPRKRSAGAGRVACASNLSAAQRWLPPVNK